MTLLERFNNKYIPVTESGCWLWVGASANGGYGQIKLNAKKQLAHRISWQLEHGEIPSGLDVLHRCDVTCCVNPTHLFLGTDSDNQKDSVMKGRAHCTRNVDRSQWNSRTIKLTREQANEIYSSHGPLRPTAEAFGISQCHVSSIRAGRVWKYRVG